MKENKYFYLDIISFKDAYFGLYTIAMFLTGFFLGISGWFFSILGFVSLIISFYTYAKNKEILEEREQIEDRLNEIRGYEN